MYKVTLFNDGNETVIHSPHFDDIKVSAGTVKQEINVAYGFTLSVTPNNPGYFIMRPLKTLLQVLNTKTQELEFDGRVLMPTESMSTSGVFDKSYVCESELGYLNDSSQRHGEYHDITVEAFLRVIIENHNADVADDDIDKHFEVGIVDVDSSTGTLYRYLGYESTMDAIEDKLIDRLGGEIRVRKENGIRYLDYVQSIGEYKSTEIRLSKNLQSITKETDPSEIITRLVPLGEKIESDNEDDTDASQARLTIESVNDGKDYIDDDIARAEVGVITKSEKWNDIIQPDILKTRGEQFLQEKNRVKSKHKLSALDLSVIGLDVASFDLCNHYPVINPIMNIDEHLRVIKKTIDILNPESSSLDVGDKFMTASEYQNKANKSREKVVELENTVERQSQRIASIQSEMNNVDEALKSLNNAIGDADVPALETAISNLNDAVSDLIDAVDAIPDYDVATETMDGLMAKEDKVKLNGLQNYDVATNMDDGLMSAPDKAKLDLISVISPVDIENILQRLKDLENEKQS